MAVVCACLITYRPLFADLNFTLLSSLSWNKRSASTLKRKEQWRGTGSTNDSYDPIRWSLAGNMSGEKDLRRSAELDSMVTKWDLDLAKYVGPPVSGTSYAKGHL